MRSVHDKQHIDKTTQLAQKGENFRRYATRWSIRIENEANALPSLNVDQECIKSDLEGI